MGVDCVRAKSYMDLHREMSADIEAERKSALDLLGPSAASVRAAVAELLAHRTFAYPLSVLPVIVHAVETGEPGPAVPLAVVHELWWTSACYLDDLADGQAVFAAGGLGESEALLATVISGIPLPLLVVQSPRIPERARVPLSAEIVRCWITATEGQLRDLRADVGAATVDAVVTAYLGKSGAPFSMVTAMAAQLAGRTVERVELWREFGNVFGILWQLFNDQQDILTGRDEDLANGTVTYLLACALEEATPDSVGHVLELHSAARRSPEARAALTGVLLAPEVLRRYEKDISGFRDRAHGLLRELGGDSAYLSVLHDLVDQASPMLLQAAEPYVRAVPAQH
ncbi:polyprenyl synthetase family protein [Streptomyces sp. NPDC002742]|uniref:polyprenyl synthetase family protein n=1 Tax=Streptomyces sp. NPDC002742 TaxID=3364663 RepID=UPI003684EF61